MYATEPGEPTFGDIATIANIYRNRRGECLELVEFPAPEDDENYAGFIAEVFRPVQSTDTGMSILEQIRRDVTDKNLRPIFEDEQV
jgi:hypothetical protein